MQFPVPIRLLLAVSAGLCVGCVVEEASRPERPLRWTGDPDPAGILQLIDAREECADCLHLAPLAVLGTDPAGGLIEESGEMDDVVVDLAGNYWVGGKRGVVTVYGPGGEFLREVGAPGQGPGEFARPRPGHIDGLGRVHVFDPMSRRLSLFDATTFEMVDSRQLPGLMWQTAGLPDADSYVAQIPGSREVTAQTLKVVRGEEVITSFGPGADGSASGRVQLAASQTGRIFSASRSAYLVEAWDSGGVRLGGFAGPELQGDFIRGAITADNPLPETISSLAIDPEDLLWVAIAERRDDWVERSTPVPGQAGALAPAEDDIGNWVTGRLDVIDLPTATLLGSLRSEHLFVRLLPGGRAVQLVYGKDGEITLVISQMEYREPQSSERP